MAARLLARDAGVGFIRQIVSAAQPKHVVKIVCSGKIRFRIQHNYARTLTSTTRLLNSESEKAVVPTTEEKKDVATQSEPEEDPAFMYREKYIPITRASIVRHIMQENKLNEEEAKIYEKFALSLDKSIRNKYYGVLQQAKEMFDPLNPDKDTIRTRQWNKQERVDNEFYLLQRLRNIMEKANFHELPKSILSQAMAEHNVDLGVTVSHDSEKFEILRIWGLGKTYPDPELPFYLRAWYRVFPNQRPDPKNKEYFKRVVLAMRLRKDQKLLLKGFKDVPLSSLEMLMPDVKIQMTKIDKLWLGSSIAVFSLTALAKAVAFQASLQANWMLGPAIATVAIGWTFYYRYQNRRNRYQSKLFQMLYNNNIANNRGLLTLVVDRAEDESFKEALLVYTFLLTHRYPSVRDKPMTEMDMEDLGGITQSQLERKVEDWVFSKTNVQIDFASEEAIAILKEYGLLTQKRISLHVMPLQDALKELPQRLETVLMRELESDRAEDHDDEKFT